MRRPLAAAALLAFLALGAGCAVQPVPAPKAPSTPPASASPPSSSPPVAAQPGPPVGTTASGGTIRLNGAPAATAPTSAVVDSTPSPEALAVLSSIPEPSAPAGTTPTAMTPAPTPAATPQAAPAMPVAPPQTVPHATGTAPADSAVEAPAATAAEAPADSAGVPVPEPTEPLGDRPGSLASAALPESLIAAASDSASASPSAAAPPSAGAPAAGSAPPDSCWRVQVAAPPERERADRLAEAARSQMLIAMVIEREGGLYKVRTLDCYTAITADDLKRRAIETGFAGAFRFLRKTR